MSPRILTLPAKTTGGIRLCFVDPVSSKIVTMTLAEPVSG